MLNEEIFAGIDAGFIAKYPDISRIVVATRMFLDGKLDGNCKFVIQEDPDGYDRPASWFNSMEASTFLKQRLTEANLGFWSNTLCDLNVSSLAFEDRETGVVNYNTILVGFPGGLTSELKEQIAGSNQQHLHLRESQQFDAIELVMEARDTDNVSVQDVWMIDITSDQVGLPKIVIRAWEDNALEQLFSLSFKGETYSAEINASTELADYANQQTLTDWNDSWIQCKDSVLTEAERVIEDFISTTDLGYKG